MRPEVLKTAGRKKAHVAIVSIVRQILGKFFPGGFLQRLVDVGRVTELTHLETVLRRSPPLMRKVGIKSRGAP